MTIGCVGAFGSGPFGSMPFGSGAALAVVLARQSSLNSVDVMFNIAPRAGDPGNVHDATNPANWTLLAVDPFDSTIRLCQTCVRLSSTVIRVYFDGPLDPFVTYSIVVDPGVTTPSGGPLAVLGCADWTFSTMGWPRALLPEAARLGEYVDVANPQTPRDAPSPLSPLGTFQIDDTGDLANDKNRQNLRKRVYRRMMSVEGSFFHLPNYGFGKPIKSLTLADTMRRMQSQAVAQIKQEPDVKAVTVEVSSPFPGIVRLAARVEDRYGRTETVVADVRRPS